MNALDNSEYTCVYTILSGDSEPSFVPIRGKTSGTPFCNILNVPGYEMLGDVLSRAFDQAASGKGAERHAQGELFENQPMQVIADMVGIGFPLGQAIKKMQESQRLPHEAAIRELLGSIVYIAGAIIKLERDHAESTT